MSELHKWGRKRIDIIKWFQTVWWNFCFALTCLNADLCGWAMQQREYRSAVWDGPSFSNSGLWCALLPGLQCGGLVPLASLLPPQPFCTGHKHTGPVPGTVSRLERSSWSLPMWDCDHSLLFLIILELFLSWRSPVHRDDSESVRPS